MTLGDVLWLALRWLHAVAAVAWVGSVLVYATVVEPGLKSPNSTSPQAKDNNWPARVRQSISGEWRELLEIAAFVLLVSGALLAFNRLTQPRIGITYVHILGVKVTLSAAMAFLTFTRIARRQNSHPPPRWRLSPAGLTASLGALVILLAIILRWLYERSLVP